MGKYFALAFLVTYIVGITGQTSPSPELASDITTSNSDTASTTFITQTSSPVPTTGSYITSPTTESFLTSKQTSSTEEPTTTALPSDGTTTSSDGTTTSSDGTTISSDGTSSQSTGSSTFSPTPTIVPTPTPVPKGDWNITRYNHTCIRAELQVKFEVTGLDPPLNFSLPSDATTDDSTCNGTGDTQHLSLSFNNAEVSFIFVSVHDQVYVESINFIFGKLFNETLTNQKLFPATAGKSYLCNSQREVKMGNVTMTFQTVHLQAFLSKDDTGFSTAEDCDEKLSNIVPIAVGCALAALVIIVLIAYLVGRRRSRQKGYQSV